MSNLLARSRYNRAATESAALRRIAELSMVSGQGIGDVIIELETTLNIIKSLVPDQSDADPAYRDRVIELINIDILAVEGLRYTLIQHDRNLKRVEDPVSPQSGGCDTVPVACGD